MSSTVNYKKILIIAPHPDDEILGCGGTMAKAIAQNIAVHVLYLSSGDSIEKTREQEANAVCNYLGVKSLRFLRLKGESFSVSQENIDKLVDVFKEINPNLVYINHDQDSDFEHRIAYQLTVESFWRFNNQVSENQKIKGLVLYEVHKPMQNYSIVEDISDFMSTKMAAMELYKSQTKDFRIDQAIEGLNKYRGTMHEACNYAEVFQLKKMRSILS